MARKFYTSDLHLGMTRLVQTGFRPFESVEKMNERIIANINARCTEEDILICLGDFCSVGKERETRSLNLKQKDYVSMIHPTVVNVEGNHDKANGVKSIATYMRTTLGRRYTSVSCSHYPSVDLESSGTFRKGDVHLHGHHHQGSKFTIDWKNRVLNVNVACDIWKLRPVSEDELMVAIDQFILKANRQGISDISKF